MNKIGFVGIGKMGMPIACNLLKNGYEVKLPAHMAGLAGCAPGHASDLNWEALQLFTKRGGRYEESFGRLVAHCPILAKISLDM